MWLILSGALQGVGGGRATTHQDGHGEQLQVTAYVSLCIMMGDETPTPSQKAIESN